MKNKNVNNLVEKGLSILRSNSYKITPQRRAVLEALSTEKKFFTIQEIMNLIHKNNPDISLDTIYRNVTLLTELKIVNEIIKPNGTVYEIIVDENHHHHLICTKCGKTICINLCPLNESIKKEANNCGFYITGHVFEFYGLCHTCHSHLSNK